MGPTTHPLHEMVDEDRQSNHASSYRLAPKKITRPALVCPFTRHGAVRTHPRRFLLSVFFRRCWVCNTKKPLPTLRGSFRFLLKSTGRTEPLVTPTHKEEQQGPSHQKNHSINLLHVQQVAHLLTITARTLWHKIRKEELPVIRVAAITRINGDTLQEMWDPYSPTYLVPGDVAHLSPETP